MQFQVAMHQAKRMRRQTLAAEHTLRRAEIEATRRIPQPRRPLHTSRAALWRWYRATGRSWAQFVADHGEPG